MTSDGARCGLLECLEQGVGGPLGESVGVLDDDDPPRPDRGPQPGLVDELAGVLDLDRQALGGDDLHVGVAAVEGGAAFAAFAAAVLSALQCCRESPCCSGSPAARRTGQQPGVGHRLEVARGPAQCGDGLALPDHVAPDGHGAPPAPDAADGGTGAVACPAPAGIGSTPACCNHAMI